MAVIQDIIAALWQHDFARWRILILLALFTLSCLPRCFRKRPAARLIFARRQLVDIGGALIAQGVMDFLPTIAILTAQQVWAAG